MMQKKIKKLPKHLHMDINMRVLSESYPINTNMMVLNGFQKYLRPCVLIASK